MCLCTAKKKTKKNMRFRKKGGDKTAKWQKKKFLGWHWYPGPRAASLDRMGEKWARRQNSG